MAKGIMVIDGQRVPFDGERNVLAVIRKAGIDIPTFCYYSRFSASLVPQLASTTRCCFL
jgi:NADH-quinone oxidoreductase subunit G